jgi:hypothetical protein
VVSLVVRFRRSRGVERQQIKWFAYAAVVYAALIPLDLLGLDEPLGDIVWSSLNNAATLGVYVAVGIAILRYRLYQIDIIINRTLVYVSLTVMLVLSYLGASWCCRRSSAPSPSRARSSPSSPQPWP